MGSVSIQQCGVQALLEERKRFLAGSGRPSALMLVLHVITSICAYMQ